MGRWICLLLLAVCATMGLCQDDAELDQMLAELQTPNEDAIPGPDNDEMRDIYKRSIEDEINALVAPDSETDMDSKKRSIEQDIDELIQHQTDEQNVAVNPDSQSDMDVKKRSPESDMYLKKRSIETETNMNVQQKRSAQALIIPGDSHLEKGSTMFHVVEDAADVPSSAVEVRILDDEEAPGNMEAVSAYFDVDEPETNALSSSVVIDNEVSAAIEVLDDEDETAKRTNEIEANSAYVEVVEDDGLAEAATGDINIQEPAEAGDIAFDNRIAATDIRVDEPVILEQPIATHDINIEPIEFVEADTLKSNIKSKTETEKESLVQPHTIQLRVSKQVPAIGVPPRKRQVPTTPLSRDPAMLALLATVVTVTLLLSLFICFVTVKQRSTRLLIE